MLKSVRLSAECYDKHFAIFILIKNSHLYIYNRTIHTTPEILDADKVTPPPAHNGLYQILLAMKYLRSSDEEWTVFVDAFDKLIQNNIGVVSLTAMNFPADWKAHLSV